MSFKLQLEKFAEKAGAKADLVVRKIVLEVYASLVYKSPVDTGRFRGNWNISMAGFDPTVRVEGFTKDSLPIIAKASHEVERYQGGRIYISNNLPYARRLEDGYSKQAPAGMVRITVVEFQDMVDRVVKSV